MPRMTTQELFDFVVERIIELHLTTKDEASYIAKYLLEHWTVEDIFDAEFFIGDQLQVYNNFNSLAGSEAGNNNAWDLIEKMKNYKVKKEHIGKNLVEIFLLENDNIKIENSEKWFCIFE